MNTTQRNLFKSLFETQKTELLKGHKMVDENFQIQSEDLKDEVDLMVSETETSMRMRLRNREALFVKKIDEALERIQLGTFGDCDTCGEEIESRRLQARPTTTLCITCKEEEESSERIHIGGHRSKSLGVKLRIAQ